MKAKQALEILTSGTYQWQDTLEAVAVAIKALKKTDSAKTVCD